MKKIIPFLFIISLTYSTLVYSQDCETQPEVVMNQPSDQEICSGSELPEISFTSDDPNTTYSWTASFSNINIDQSATNTNGGSGWESNVWQSFTAGHTALLYKVKLGFYQTNTIGVFKIYQGEGTSGTLLYTGQFSAFTANNSAMVDIPLDSPIALTQGSKYTMSMVTEGAKMWFSSGATYSGGRVNYNGAFLSGNRSIKFQTYILRNDNYGLPSLSGVGNIPSFTAINSFQHASTTSSGQPQATKDTYLGPVTVNITVTPERNGCYGTPKDFSIIINPLNQITYLHDKMVCNGGNTSVDFTGGEPGTTCSWTNDTPSIGLPASGSGDIASFQAVNSGTSLVTATITVSPSADVCNATTQRTFTITVIPTPQVDEIDDQTIDICNNQTTSPINFTGSFPGISYDWTNDNPSIGLRSSYFGNIPSFTVTNTGTSPYVATITVTPKFMGCSGPSKTFTITANPAEIIVDQPANQEVCNGSELPEISFTSNVSEVTHDWNVSFSNTLDQSATNTNGGSGWESNVWQSFTAGHTALLYKVKLGFYQTNTIGVFKIYQGEGTSGTLLYTGQFSAFTANNSAMVDIPLDSPIALTQGSKYTMSMVTEGAKMWFSSGATYSGGRVNYNGAFLSGNRSIKFQTFMVPNDFYGLPSLSGSGNIPSFTASNNNSLQPVIATVFITPKQSGCVGTTKNFTITINDYTDQTVNSLENQSLYDGQSTTPVIFNGASEGTIYSWENDNPSIGLAANGTGNIGLFETVNTGSTPVTANITVTPLKGSCAGESQSFTITVNPKIPLTIAGISGVNKVYDGTTTASASVDLAFLSVVDIGDDVILEGSPIFSFSSANVGTGITVNTSGYTISGADAYKYNLIQPTLSADITPKGLTISGISGVDKVYDGTTIAFATGAASLLGVESVDQVTLGGSPSFSFVSVNVDTDITINTTGYTINGSDSGNYTLTQPTLSADITVKELTITGISGVDKVYDGTTTAFVTGVASLSGIEPGDQVILGGSPSFIFASATAATEVIVNTTGYTTSGSDSENYTLTQPILSADIIPAPLTVVANSGQAKVYGSTDPTLTYTISGFIGDDTEANLDTPVSILRGAGESVGNYPILTYGAADSNYSITFANSNFSITPALLTVTASSGQTKVYGSDDPTLTYSFTGFVLGDLESDLDTGVIISRDAGETVGNYSIIPSAAADSNYTVSFETADFSITQANLMITGLVGNNKEYDGTTDATVSGTPVLSGVITGDDVVLEGNSVFTFESAELGTDITITTTGFIITGSDSGNYTLTQPTLSADIFTTLGVDDITDVKSSLKLHPNPAFDYIRISGLSEKANYIIYNVLGKKVVRGKVFNEEDIAIEGLSNGTYFIKIKNAKAIKFIKK